MKNTYLVAALLLVVSPLSAMAATMLESKEADGMVTRIYIDGSKARFESPDNQGYIVFDTEKKTMHFVVTPQRLVVDMSASLKAGHDQNNSLPALKFKSKGQGPKVIGYTTTAYDEFVDGQYCGSVFASPQAAKESGINKFIKDFSVMMAEMNNMFGGMMEQHMDACDKAALGFSDKMIEIGLPLKSFDRNHAQESEIIKLDKKARLPSDAFSIPSDYKRITPQQFAQEMMRQMPQDMEGMMQNMSPEALEQMQQQMMQNMPPEVLEMMKQQMQGQ